MFYHYLITTMQLITNLNFKGNCEEAFKFYATALQGELSEFSRYSQMPADPAMPLPANIANQIMHVSISKNGTMILMGADMMPGFSPEYVIGTNMEVCIMTDNKSEADRIFNALGDGGSIAMPMEDQFWGDYFGSVNDKYNVSWMILCPGKQQS